MNKNWLNTDMCTGCGACSDKCPVNCISMVDDGGCRKPDIDLEKCLNCNQCKKVCPNFIPVSNLEPAKKSFIACYKVRDIAIKSSSGGMFAALANYILSIKGVVYGATMSYTDNTLICKHIRIDNKKDISLLQGSKYVQSRLDGIYTEVKRDLSAGKIVLFSGTSCQVASLRNFVGHHDCLYTVDLVCHGVPKDKLFYDYVHFLEKKFDGKVESIAFRTKEIFHHGIPMLYTIQAKLRKEDSTVIAKNFIRPKSSFYRLFSNRAGYRESCYQCKYASTLKPSDLTLGDFRPSATEIVQYGLNPTEHYSSVFLHSPKGSELLEAIDGTIWSCEMPLNEMLKHHLNMQHPSILTEAGKKYYNIYLRGGFRKLNNYVFWENFKNRSKGSINSLAKRVLNSLSLISK